MNEANKIEEAIRDPQNLGEMSGADAMGTAGSSDCGDMLRMWIKFREDGGRKVIDKATFQSFGCQTAIAVASMATEMLKGKTIDEARQLSAEQMTGELGPLPPMKIHCGQLVEGALKNALDGGSTIQAPNNTLDLASGPTLADSLRTPQSSGKIRIVKLDPNA